MKMTDITPLILLGIIIVGFIIVFTVSLPTIKGAPWLPTKRKKIRRMLEIANVQPGELVYDLGCGDGRVLIMAARKFGACSVGIEIDLMRFLWCQFLITILGLRKKIRVIYGDFFKQDLSDADVIFCYLLQSTNNKLEDKLLQEVDPSTRVVSNTFMFHGLALKKTDGESGLLVYSTGIEEN